MNEFQSVLENGKWFSSRSDAFKSDVLERAHLKSIEAGQRLFSRGESANGVFAVLDGSIRISGHNKEGKESLLTFIDPPDWFGELALFDSDPRTHDAVAALDTDLLFIPQSSLEALLTLKPVYWRDFGIMLSNKLRLSFGLIEDMALLPASKRLTKRIFLMAENAALNQIRSDLVINVDQASLAAMLSISRQTANQILRGLEERGVISLEYGKIKVRDLEALKLAAMPS
ncbi:hypothetical protein A3742_10655 [Oleiphilus sp. HI0071]|uniref:Crp/Fnr family transcriptional regulator n=1 Tax=unclassified Oleiphilus TaxID=2631174 RepID=UPI0007C21D39|nr:MULTISPECIES: Crp/Fnr family transcriptional regulator [unclassified Oleiphilus]KZY60777.1 hypothetical protein A3737_22920 [Oleiphilus sp. HI0065]KZY81906.1 hypothetical protein A3742_10655 [Oleiphilus sp. HI0071]KZY91678.1 hypothetical protein A3744_15055 [Oleiphilus sp. HI0073]KZZ61871.1 hypothetical protein A3760_00240 [Oleiphilus sp. HI0122]KZZ73740.1 hypothetical protein A3767_23615 [Oleiphilus sp. HI0133]